MLGLQYLHHDHIKSEVLDFQDFLDFNVHL